VSTYDRYTTPLPPGTWDVPAAGATRFSWEYDNGRDRLLSLYQRGKDKQWDAAKRIDWSIPVDPANVMGMPEELNPIYGSAQWDKLSQAERDELAHHLSSWLFSQFLHGEQGALTVAARIVESVLWGPKVRHAYADLGGLDAAKSDLEALMRDDAQIADRMEREYAAEFAARTAEVGAAITEGSAG